MRTPISARCTSARWRDRSLPQMARAAGRTTCARRGSSWVLPCTPLQHVAALGLIQPAPDAVRLPGGEREAQTLLAHGTARANGLRLRLAREFLFLGFLMGGREEEIGIGAATRGLRLPIGVLN